MNAFMAGLLTGGAVTWALLWRFARAVERYRRGRVDLRGYVDGIRGQMQVVRDNFLTMVKLGAYVVLALVVVVFVVYQGVRVR